ncbi:TPA: hypothetical protein ACH3X2_007907 [Trebouxia sp. C0005]|nr:MAG: hypothetical protein FRX49_07474 [Trebouxia sp. A1-2]
MAPEEVWLITGASRGIGAELVKQVLAKDNTKVVAGARSPKTSPLLHNLQDRYQDRLHTLALDVSSNASILAAAESVTNLLPFKDIDYLVNNAAIANAEQTRAEKPDTLTEMLQTNVIGVHAMTQAFLPLLQSGQKKTVINISSAMGSMNVWYHQFTVRNDQPIPMTKSSLGYKVSKAALNMRKRPYFFPPAACAEVSGWATDAVTLSWASDVTPEEGFTFVAIEPGTVDTDASTAMMQKWGMDKTALESRLSPAQAVGTMLETIAKLTPEDSGRFLKSDGNVFLY